LIADDDPAHVEAVDADIARRDRAEAANFVGAVEADGLIADAGAEGVVGRRDGILAGPLSHRGRDEAAGCKQANERVSQWQRRSSAVHGSSRKGKHSAQPRSHDGKRS
jgi:hypothetical protein